MNCGTFIVFNTMRSFKLATKKFNDGRNLINITTVVFFGRFLFMLHCTKHYFSSEYKGIRGQSIGRK